MFEFIVILISFIVIIKVSYRFISFFVLDGSFLHVKFICLRKIAAKMELVFIVLEIVPTLLRCPSWKLISNYLPVSTMLLEKLNKLFFFISLPLVLSFDAASK